MRPTWRPVLLAVSAVTAAGMLASCSSSGSSRASNSASAAARGLAPIIQSELAGKVPASVRAELNQDIPLGMGQVVPGYPEGVTPSPANIFHFTAADIAKLKAGHYTAAIAMHVSDAAWPDLQIKGITTELAKFGIKVVATTSAGGVASTQITQIATLITRKPTAIFSIPVDPTAEASEYRQISASGIKLVLLDNVPSGLTPGKQYVTVVSANNGGNGLFAAQQLQRQIGCGGLGVIDLDYYFPVVNTRDTAALNYLRSTCPARAQYTQALSNLVVTPAFTEAGAMLGQHPGGIKGFWAAWNSIAEEIVSAEEAAGVKIPIATTDIDATSALEMAQGYITAVGGQQPYAQGVAEADALAYNLLGKQVPPFIELPTVPVTLADLIPAYEEVNGTAPPANVIAAIKSAVGLGL